MEQAAKKNIHPDQKYIDALINNDLVLMEELYQKFSGKIKWMILQNNGNEMDAADIFQEGLLSVFNKAKTNDFILTCPFEAFLLMICKSKWINELNKRKSQGVTFMDTDGYNDVAQDSFRDADECLQRDARKELLAEKIEELGEGCKQILRLSWSGKAMEEVADILNVTYGYARKKKSECMGKLVTLIKESSKFNILKW